MKKHKIIIISLSVICIILLIIISFLLGRISNKDKGINREIESKNSLFENVPDSIRMRAKADSDAVLMGMDNNDIKDIRKTADSLTKVYMKELKKEKK